MTIHPRIAAFWNSESFSGRPLKASAALTTRRPGVYSPLNIAAHFTGIAAVLGVTLLLGSMVLTQGLEEDLRLTKKTTEP